jgi:hypothetical protein
MKLFLAQSWGPLQAQLSYLLRNILASQRRKCAHAARIAAGETAISHNSQRPTTASVGIFVALTLAGLAMPRQAAADEVFDWNVTGFEATLAGGQNAILISRTMAMTQLAIHDALNAIEPRYEPYLYEGKAEPSADAGAAIAAAAHDVLAAVIPGWGKPEQRAKALAIVDSAYSTALGKLRDGPAKERGVAVGQTAPQRCSLPAKRIIRPHLRDTRPGQRRANGDLTPILCRRILPSPIQSLPLETPQHCFPNGHNWCLSRW